MYETNRSVFLLIPRQPFWNWLSSLPDVEPDGWALEDLQLDANAYLVDPCEDEDDLWDQIAPQFETLFAAELADWCEDEALWPDLHPDIFAEWFDVRLSRILTDLSAKPVEREPFSPFDLIDGEKQA